MIMIGRVPRIAAIFSLLLGWSLAARSQTPEPVPESAKPTEEARPPKDEADLRRWLEIMVAHHRFSLEEVQSATGLDLSAIRQALERFDIVPGKTPSREAGNPLLVMPYPGGRHPRIGFLDGAIRPQRETKVSVFSPWDPESYVVLDVPEAIWSNLGLTYLAHTHVPTVWTEQDVELPKLEWHRGKGDSWISERRLPNGIEFGTKVMPHADHVRMEMWLVNRSEAKLTDLRVQNCVLLKGAPEFAQQTNENKVFSGPYAACHSSQGDRWIITAWDPVDQVWANPPCPCLHSDPRFPDCEVGQTQRLQGWFSFFEGTDIHGEIARIEKLGWRQATTSR